MATATPTRPPLPTAVPARAGPETSVLVALVALAVGVLVLVGWFPRIAVPDVGDEPIGLISGIYDPPGRSVEVALNIGDGQVFATQAVDPLALDAPPIGGGPEETAYRYQRGAYGWVGWIASGGRAAAVPWALAGVTVASVAALVGVAAELIRRRGGPPAVALVLLLTPGVITNLLFVGPEALGTALVLLGFGAWSRRPGAWTAVAAFAAAGLCRETLLVVPATLAVLALVDRRQDRALRLAAAAVPYGAWVAYLRIHLGAWPSGSTGGRLSAVPFSGLVERAGGWGLDDGAGLALVAALAVVGLVRARTADLRALIGVHLALAAALGPAVWAEAAHAGRLLLPLCALALVAAAAPLGPQVTAGGVPPRT